MDTRRDNSKGAGYNSSQRINLQEANRKPLLGMRLEKTEELFSLLESRLPPPPMPKSSRHQPMSEKLKASNFPITKICVGNWQRVSKNEGELTAKIYFAKRKLVWEFLNGELKSKMEVSWSDITAIQAIMDPDQLGFLQIQLGNPPSFFRETTPQPRKHTNWQQASDFTNGQAPLYRKQFAWFPPAALDKHYEKLLHCDQRLLELSRRPFPTNQSPYFDTLPFTNMPQDHYPTPISLQPTLIHPPIITAAAVNYFPLMDIGSAARNSTSVWGNQMNNEATFVENTIPDHGEQVMIENANAGGGGDDSWLTPHIQQPNNGITMEAMATSNYINRAISQNLYPNHQFRY